MANLNAFLWLNTCPGISPEHHYALIRRFGSPEAVYYADEEEYALAGLSPAWRKALADKSMERVEKVLEDCERLGVRILTIQDASYPERLAQIEDPPCVLYLKGREPDVDRHVTIGLVGARNSTPYGERVAYKLGGDLARMGVTLVSGTAVGIDAAGLRGALKSGGTVISVLGNGINVHYPRVNRWLYEDVAAAGTLVSEYPPGTEAAGFHFPVRNRILSGLSMGVVVAEADVKSGALITARRALDQGREVFAVPGPVDAPTYRGCHDAIQRGEAKLIRNAGDILEEFSLWFPEGIRAMPPLDEDEPPQQVKPPRREKKSATAGAKETAGEKKEVDKEPQRAYISLSDDPEAFPDDQRDVLLALAEGDLTADAIVEATQIPARRVLSALTLLEVGGHLEERPGKRYHALVILVP